MRVVKALLSLCICAGSSEHLLLHDAISIKISCAVSCLRADSVDSLQTDLVPRRLPETHSHILGFAAESLFAEGCKNVDHDQTVLWLFSVHMLFMPE